MSTVLRFRLSVAPDLGAAVLLVCAGPVELLDGPAALLVLAVVLDSVLVEFAVVDVTIVVLLTRVSDEVSVVMAVGKVVFADAGIVAMAVTAVSVVVVLAGLVVATVSVVVVEGEIMLVVVVEGVAEGRIMGAPVVVERALVSVVVVLGTAAVLVVLSAAAVVETVVLATASVVEVVERPFGTGTGT